jgi:hypothetical protein
VCFPRDARSFAHGWEAHMTKFEKTGLHLAIGNAVVFAIVCTIVWTFDAPYATAIMMS